MKPRLSLKGRGLQLLAQREHSRVELHRKLLRHARDDVAAERARAQREMPLGADGVPLERSSKGASVTRARRGSGSENRPGIGIGIGITDTDTDTDTDTSCSTSSDVESQTEAESESDKAPDLVAQVDAVIDWLEGKGFFSASRFVESRVNARAPRFGMQRIRQELAQHGVSLSPDELKALKDTEFDRARAVWQRKFGQPPADLAERGRQLRFMAARGFSGEVVRRIMHLHEDD
ncbi:MAG: hypothetical protein RLZZ618_727 [Pseudomonadota bacterium]|jgi:regulatory protein